MVKRKMRRQMHLSCLLKVVLSGDYFFFFFGTRRRVSPQLEGQLFRMKWRNAGDFRLCVE